MKRVPHIHATQLRPKSQDERSFSEVEGFQGIKVWGIQVLAIVLPTSGGSRAYHCVIIATPAIAGKGTCALF